MRKCVKCDVVFNLEERSRCLYCNSLLMSVAPGEETKHEDSLEDFPNSSFVQESDPDMVAKAPSKEAQEQSPPIGFLSREEENTFIMQVIKDRRAVAYDRRFYVVGSYFKSRTLHFMYCFSRNELKMGKTYRRALIQPLNMSSFLVIPWVVLNLLDTFFLRLSYNGFCPQCGWKYKKSGDQPHDPRECEYNQEYREIILDILSGKIVTTEPEYRKLAQAKAEAGQRSAYQHLCSGSDFFSGFLDVVCIWFSISLVLVFVIVIAFPQIGVMLNKVDGVEPMELR